MKQGYQLIILGLLGAGALAFAAPRRASAQTDVHPETHTAEEEAEQAEETQGTPPEEDHGPKRSWRNSAFMVDQSVNMWTLTHDGLTYDPTFFLLLRFSPRYYVNDNFIIKLSQTMYLEESQSDSTTYNLQPSFWDLYVDAVATELVKVGDFTLNVGGRILVPWSIASQANRTYLGVGGTVSAAYAFPHVAEGLITSFDIAAIYNISDTNVTHLEQNHSCTLASSAGGDVSQIVSGVANGTCDQTAGASTTAFYILFGPTVALTPIKKMTVSLSLLSWASLGRDLAPATLGRDTVATGPVTIADTSPTHWRNLEVMYLSVGYDVTPWLNLAINYFAFTNFLDPQGNWRVPLYGPDEEVSITAFFTLDQLYNAVTGETHDPTRAAAHRASAATVGGML